jgi:molybdenum cofactor cytidylyltransferase
MSIAAVILAAGFSRRLGRPKQTVMLNGETLVERSVRIAQQAGFSLVIAVVNPEGDFGYSLQQLGCVLSINKEATEGMAASIRSGITTAQALRADGALLMTCDQIALTPQHLLALCSKPEGIAGSGYAGKVGVPVYFPASSFSDLLKLRGDVGARNLLRDARVVPAEELSLDIDNEADVARAKANFSSR